MDWKNLLDQIAHEPWNLTAGRKLEFFFAHIECAIPASADIDVTQPAMMPLADVSDRNGLVRFNRADDILVERIQNISRGNGSTKNSLSSLAANCRVIEECRAKARING